MKTLLVSEKNGILSVSLNRPDVRNAFSAEMISELTAFFSNAKNFSSARAVVLKGEGKVFCAGADLSYMQEMVKFSFEKNRDEALALHKMFEAIESCPLPVVAQVHGAAFGGALGLIAVSDLVIAEEKTRLCFSEVKLGLAPAVISDFVLRKTPVGLVGPWMLSGLVFSANEARLMGLVHFVSDQAAFDSAAETALQSFRESGAEAIRETKKLIRRVPSLSREDARQETARVISERRVSAEGQEGLKSFLEKREPSWRLK